MARHYIAMNCTPEYITTCSTREAAVLTLVDRIAGPELATPIHTGLTDYGVVWLGAGHYAEITACDCDDPTQHNDE